MSDETMAIDLIDESNGLPADRFLDRETSWLAFNQRVLELAEDPNLYLLERVNFLSIFASNLDEFFMVRVAGLKRRIATGLAENSASGLAPAEVLTRISQEAHRLQQRHAHLFRDQIEPALRANGIRLVRWHELDDHEKSGLHTYFQNQIFPVLTPLAVDPAHPFPYISGLSLNLAVVVRNVENETDHFARVKVPPLLPRFVRIPTSSSSSDARYVPLEDIIGEFLGQLFPGMQVMQHHAFRVTRNEDLDVDEDEGENLLVALEKELLRRRFGPPVRLEVANDINPEVLDLLMRELDITDEDVYHLPSPLDLTGLNEIAFLKRPELHYPIHPRITNRYLHAGEDEKIDIFAAIRQREILVHHPYESFTTSVVAFLQAAAADPNVLAIKQTLYRTSGDSPIMMALIEAAKSGKQVLAVIELRARFDEQANVRWAKKLEDAGAHVVYGVLGLKTHAKASLVVRREDHGLTVYSHIGTGNYNPKTARIYDDLGVMSADPLLGQDLLMLFNQLSGVLSQSQYSRLLVAPHGIRTQLLEKIERERRNHLDGKPSQIRWKVNSLVDNVMIDALYQAAKDGVPIELYIRGACSFRMSKVAKYRNVQVRSILGRFLEHSRIYNFHNGGDPEFYIGSADIMERNLDRRIEALLRIDEVEHKAELAMIFELSHSPRFRMWEMAEDDTWNYRKNGPEGKPLEDFQEYFIERYKK